jgi:hypothetical protein
VLRIFAVVFPSIIPVLPPTPVPVRAPSVRGSGIEQRIPLKASHEYH